MADKTLIALLDEVRGKTLRMLDGVSAEHAAWAPPGLQNSIRWHAGHSYVVVEWLTTKTQGREPQIPAGWFDVFSWESKPAEVPPDRWPSLADVVSQLGSQHKRLRETLAKMTDYELNRPAQGKPEVTVRERIVHGLHDEACHCGEIMLLRKMLSVKH
jgi:DinB superfamily